MKNILRHNKTTVEQSITDRQKEAQQTDALLDALADVSTPDPDGGFCWSLWANKKLAITLAYVDREGCIAARHFYSNLFSQQKWERKVSARSTEYSADITYKDVPFHLVLHHDGIPPTCRLVEKEVTQKVFEVECGSAATINSD